MADDLPSLHAPGDLARKQILETDRVLLLEREARERAERLRRDIDTARAGIDAALQVVHGEKHGPEPTTS